MTSSSFDVPNSFSRVPLLAVFKIPWVPWLVFKLEMLLRLRASVGLLVSDQDLEAADDLCKRNAGVILPVLNSLRAVNEDDKVLGLALVVDLGLSSVTASHDVSVCESRFGEKWLSVFWES